MHQATCRQAAPQGHVKRLESKLCAQVGLHRPADDTTREQIEDDRQVEPAFPSPDEGYVRHPELVRSFGFEVPTEHVGCDRTIVLAVGHAAKTLAGQALQTHLTHQPCHSLLAHLDVLSVKLATYTLPAVGCAFYLFIRQPMGRKSALRREIPWILRGFQGRLSC